MAVKNLQTVAVCVAEFGVRVTGTGSPRFTGKRPAPLSLPRQPRSGYRIRTGPDAELMADNAAAAKAVIRVGRSTDVRSRSRAGAPITRRRCQPRDKALFCDRRHIARATAEGLMSHRC